MRGELTIDTEARFAHLAKQHPCLGKEAHRNKGRVHLPVSPTCNIACRFCKRSCNTDEQRPGVASGLLDPNAAPAIVAKALELCPEISVVGVAGPGDTLATDHAIQALGLVHKAYPELIKCLSTNGLRLPERVDELVKIGVSTLTVTVNGISPAAVSSVVGWIVDAEKKLSGEDAARILTSRQLEGIKLAAKAGILVKINMVLVPGINDHEVAATARAVREAGASLFNILPLIPQEQLAHIPAPDCRLLNRTRAEAEKELPVFRHCSHCRADACGIPGVKDLSETLYGQRLAAQTFSHG